MDPRALAALPDTEATLTLEGLGAQVVIHRDAFGIPHVQATTVADAFFGQGFVHAQDRLWQMEMDRLKISGRAASVLGPAWVNFDAFVRRADVVAAAHADMTVLDDDALMVLTAYAAGVNAFIASTDALPVEMTMLGITAAPWEPWHCSGVLKVRHVLMGPMHTKLWRWRLLEGLGTELLRKIAPSDGREDTLIMPVGGTEIWNAVDPLAFAESTAVDGSNSWAVHGSRSASGLPLVAGDPHRAIEVPNVYYQNHIACDDFDAIGLSMPGIPGMFHFGHNQTTAWCITHAMADTQDLFVELFDEEGRYDAGGEWISPSTHREVIAVFGAEPVEIDVIRTRNGPIVFGDIADGRGLAVRWTGTDQPNPTLNAILPILRATTVSELDEAMRSWVDPCNCVVMGDRAGDIAFLHRGRVPKRTAENGWSPVSGWTDEHAWTGSIPFDELPRMRNPDLGYIVTANNRVIGSDFEHYLAMDYASPYRARRILARLSELPAATADDMADVHADRAALASRIFIEHVEALAPADPLEVAAREVLLGWDGLMERESQGASVYSALRDELAAVVLEHEPLAGVDLDPLENEPYPTPPRARVRAGLPRLVASVPWPWDDMFAEALRRAVVTLGTPIPAWGDLHVTRARHPLSRVMPEASVFLDPPLMSVGGDGECVNAGSDDVGFRVLHSSVARYVFDVGDWEASGWVVPFGASGHAASPHYTDQQQMWADTRLIPMTYDWEKIAANAETTQVLNPRDRG